MGNKLMSEKHWLSEELLRSFKISAISASLCLLPSGQHPDKAQLLYLFCDRTCFDIFKFILVFSYSVSWLFTSSSSLSVILISHNSGAN